jgi:hypothetical protein
MVIMESSTSQFGQAAPALPPVRDLYQSLQTRVEEQPYATLAAAAGIGFILGGGLFSRLGAKLVATAIRAGLASSAGPILQSVVEELKHGVQRPR